MQYRRPPPVFAVTPLHSLVRALLPGISLFFPQKSWKVSFLSRGESREFPGEGSSAGYTLGGAYTTLITFHYSGMQRAGRAVWMNRCYSALLLLYVISQQGLRVDPGVNPPESGAGLLQCHRIVLAPVLPSQPCHQCSDL